MRAHPGRTTAALFAALLSLVGGAPAAPLPAAPGENRAALGENAWGGDETGDRLSRIEQAMWDRDPAAVPQLREWVAGDPSDLVRARSVGALALLGARSAGPLFLDRLENDPAPAVRRAAAEAIGLVAAPADITRLVRPLQKDPDPFVRAECARAIGRTRNTQAGPALLVAVLGDASQDVRALAAQAIAALRWTPGTEALQVSARTDNAVLVRIYAVRALAEVSPIPSAQLFRELWDETTEPDLRVEAFRALLAADRERPWTQAGLADGDERIRFLAFEDWLLRTRAAAAGRVAARQFEAALEEFLGDRVRGIRELAKSQLEALGVKVRPRGFGYEVER